MSDAEPRKAWNPRASESRANRARDHWLPLEILRLFKILAESERDLGSHSVLVFLR